MKKVIKFNFDEYVAIKIAIIYAIFSALWILFSDQILYFMVKDPEIMTKIQMIKGWVFILTTALIIFFLLRKEIRKYLQTEEAFRESEEKYQELINNTPDLLYRTDMEGRIVFVSPSIHRLSGYTEEEVIGIKIAEKLYVYPEERNDFLAILKKNGYVDGFETKLRRKDGSIWWISTNARFFKDRDGNILGVDGISRDVTKRKQTEEENARLEVQLQQSQKMESIGTLAGGIAHDFNNILFPIIGYTEMLIEDVPENSLSRKNLDEIYTAAIRAKELVKQILTFSRQDSTELKLIKIQPIIKEALKLIRSTIPTTIIIKQNIQAECGVIKADPTQIHQIVMNLSTNAYHAMKEKGGELKVNLKEIELSANDLISPDMKPGIYAHLTIADTGVGMDKGLLEKIFDPFFSTKEVGKGTGMGLSVVHGIILNMNGVVKVYSDTGKGTEFHVYLPVIKKTFSEKQEEQSEKPIQGGTERILLVDDEKSVITIEKQMLERLGYQITSRINSIEALNVFRDNPDEFDMIITDMAMPDMPGDKLAVELTKIRTDIPILICTGFSEAMTEEKALSLGIKGFLLKPIVIKDFAQKIREVLDANTY